MTREPDRCAAGCGRPVGRPGIRCARCAYPEAARRERPQAAREQLEEVVDDG